jgi:hypothetical protein
LGNEEMKILDDDLGHDPLQALAVGYARADVPGDIPEAALEALRERRPGRVELLDVRGDRDIEPLRSQKGLTEVAGRQRSTT